MGSGDNEFSVPGESAAADHESTAAAGVPEAEPTAQDLIIAELTKKIEKLQNEATMRLQAEEEGSLSRASSPQRFRIIISEAREPYEGQRVFVSVNGRAYDIARNVEVDVPREVVGVLHHAIIGRAVPRVDEKGISAGVDFVNAPRFPFTVVGESVDINGKQLMPKLKHQVSSRPN